MQLPCQINVHDRTYQVKLYCQRQAMKLTTNGIITNESGQVLLIQRDDSRTFAPPGGSLETGELPTDNIAREVREETGLIALPVRLVSVYFWPLKPAGMLNFVFRCIQRGGELATSEESLQVDYFWPRTLPKPMLSLHQERLERGLSHQGGPIYWGTHRQPLRLRLMSLWLGLVVYPRLNRQRKRQGKPAYVPAPQWRITAVTLIRNAKGEFLWLKQGDAWRLPGGENGHIEAPWETAVRHTRRQTHQTIQLADLSSVIVHPEEPEMTFAFIADAAIKPQTEHAWFPPGAEPESVSQWEKTAVLDAASLGDETIFRQVTGS